MHALERYEGLDATFGQTREGALLRDLVSAFENIDEDLFTDKVREFDEISRLDPQTTTLLLEIKTRIKASAVDIT